MRLVSKETQCIIVYLKLLYPPQLYLKANILNKPVFISLFSFPSLFFLTSLFLSSSSIIFPNSSHFLFLRLAYAFFSSFFLFPLFSFVFLCVIIFPIFLPSFFSSFFLSSCSLFLHYSLRFSFTFLLPFSHFFSHIFHSFHIFPFSLFFCSIASLLSLFLRPSPPPFF